MDYIHGAIVDNWSLELAGALISDEVGYKSKDRNQELIHALFDLLDIVVLNENIVYETAFSYVWDRKHSLREIKPFTVPITAIENEGRELVIREYSTSHDTKHRGHLFQTEQKITEDGAKFYLSIAEALGVQYWPAPKRQKYLESRNNEKKDKFVFLLDSDVKKTISALAAQVSHQFSSIAPNILPGFGAKILADCDSRDSIITTAIQLREDQYTLAFREWCREMDYHLETGNVVSLHKSIKDISLLFDDMYKRFSIENESKQNSGVRLQLGLDHQFLLKAN
jgi:hypothetical protein